MDECCPHCEARALKIIQLEDESELLAFENLRLIEEIKKLEDKLASLGYDGNQPNEESNTETQIDIFIDGDGNLPNKEVLKIENASGGKNVISCSFAILQEDPEKEPSDIIISGGVDNSLSFYLRNSGEFLFFHKFSAPILVIDSKNSLVACSMMDGSVGVIDINRYYPLLKSRNADIPSPSRSMLTLSEESLESQEQSSPGTTLGLLQVLKPHNKYVVGLKWSCDGAFLASLSQDKSIVLFRWEPLSPPCDLTPVTFFPTPPGSLKRITSLSFPSTPEAMIFAPRSHPHPHPSPPTEPHLTVPLSETSFPIEEQVTLGGGGGGGGGGEGNGEGEGGVVREGEGEGGGWELIVSLRDSPYLLYFDINSLSRRQVSLNPSAWDTHVSFTVLHLSLSPDSRFLLAATDKSQLYLYRLGTNQRVRTFMGGFTSREFARPKVCWDQSGHYFYCNSEGESLVYVYSVAAEREVGQLVGHRGQVRDINIHSHLREVLTASYDHSVRVWGIQ